MKKETVFSRHCRTKRIKRIIPKTEMAYDTTKEDSAGKALNTLRLYRWKPSAVSIGYFQVEEEVNLGACERLGSTS